MLPLADILFIPQMIYVIIENDGGMILTGDNRRNQEKNLSQCHFVHQKSHTE
jgi:hypothetical protein